MEDLKYEYLAMRREMRQGYGRHSFIKGKNKEGLLIECFGLLAKNEIHSNGIYLLRQDKSQAIELILMRKTESRKTVSLSNTIRTANYEQLVRIKEVLSKY